MARSTAAKLVVAALEEVGVRFTFGIPGVHNTELYDELDCSSKITPILVTNEFCGGFMADAMSRVGGSIGCLMLVPAAGLTHAMSGIAEAYLDGIPMLVITGGVRSDHGFAYQLHDVDQLEVAKGITKGAFRLSDTSEATETIFRAYDLAMTGVPGPVLVEVPVHLQMDSVEIKAQPRFVPPTPPPLPPAQQLDKVADFLNSAQRPTLYLGWGARGAGQSLIDLAERLQAPVATTLQGLAVFPHEHPLHAGFGFGPAAVPAARNAFAGHDAMLAIGVRFAEIATGSYGIDPPTSLVHVDIDSRVFDANYPATFTLEGDASAIINELLTRLEPKAPSAAARGSIARDKAAYRKEWADHDSGDRVNPELFFSELRAQCSDDVIVTMDDGNHTFLTAELWVNRSGGRVISPTDYNAMGYAVPAAVAAAIGHPAREVIAIAGDGCFRMTGYEIATATALRRGVVVFVFNDGDLAQIAQAQTLPYNKKTCTELPDMQIAGVASACGAQYYVLNEHSQLAATISAARTDARGGATVIVDVRIDYSRKTAFTEGIIKSNFARFGLRQKFRFIGRAVQRRLPG